MKGEKIFQILNSLEESILDSEEILSRIFDVSKSPDEKMESRFYKEGDAKEILKKDWKYNKEAGNYYRLIRYLKDQGSIRETKKGWIRTALGNKKIKELKTKLSKNTKNYKLEKAENPTLFIFDIPEDERWKRDWLRASLINMRFKKEQRSVWIGNFKLPKEFIKDLKRYGLLPLVKIYSVTKKGTLELKE